MPLLVAQFCNLFLLGVTRTMMVQNARSTSNWLTNALSGGLFHRVFHNLCEDLVTQQVI